MEVLVLVLAKKILFTSLPKTTFNTFVGKLWDDPKFGLSVDTHSGLRAEVHELKAIDEDRLGDQRHTAKKPPFLFLSCSVSAPARSTDAVDQSTACWTTVTIELAAGMLRLPVAELTDCDSASQTGSCE